MIVTYEKDGKSCVSDYDNRNRNTEEITILLHNSDVRVQLAELFKKNAGKTPLSELSDITLGYIIEEISKKKVFSRISNIEFHPGKTIKNFVIK